MKKLAQIIGLFAAAALFVNRKSAQKTRASLDPMRLVTGILNFRYRREPVEYVMINLPEAMPIFPPRRAWLRRLMGRDVLSLLELEEIFERIGDDPRTEGVILYLRGLNMPLADIQTLRGMILRLREQAKRVISFAHSYDLNTYYLASAGDDILLQEGGTLNTL